MIDQHDAAAAEGLSEQKLLEIEADIARFMTAAPDGPPKIDMGLGGESCGCYGNSGPYTVYCQDHDIETMMDLLLTAIVPALITDNRRLRRALQGEAGA